MAISFTPTKIARFVGALYGVALSNSVYSSALQEIYARGFDAVANEVFNADFGTQTNNAVAQTVANNLGLTGNANAEAVAYVEAQLNAAAAGTRGAVVMNALNLFAGLTSDATFGAAATAFEGKVANAILYSNRAENVQHGSFAGIAGTNVLELTTGFDKLTGTSGDDLFQGFSVGNVNTLDDGDVLDGGNGNDKLFADVVELANTITPRTNSIEHASFRVQFNQSDSGDNNIAGRGIIDAERMVGTNIYEDNNSRADLVIEDVRIGSSQITKDITVIMRDTDPGNVDFGLYFDQNSLRNQSASTSTINLRVLDTYAVAQGQPELKDSPYGSFTFHYSRDSGATWTKVELVSDAMQAAQTIDEMIAAMQIQADAAFGAGSVTVSKGVAYTVPDSVTSSTVSGNEIKLTTEAAIQFDTTRAGSGWKATETVPAISGLYTSFNTASASTTDLVTSTIILDNVGRGSNGGELIVGGLSVGDTSSSKGVQQFDITVEDTSKLDGISSTNDTLRVVNIVNGTTDVQSDAYVTRVQNAGDLTVGRSANSATSDLPGQNGSNFGFTNVQTINAATMTGKLGFTAEITQAAIAKYLNLADTANNPAADNVAFTYTGGANNDTMSVTIDGNVLASRTLTGREDFSFTANGGSGNDDITVRIDGSTAAWLADQQALNNVTINGGEGNDTIKTPGAGDFVINAGGGNDTVYSDNSASSTTTNATWVVNAAAGSTNVNDLQGSAGVTHFLYGGKLHVAISGPAAGGGVTAGNPADALSGTLAAPWGNGYEVIVDIPTGTNYSVTQYHLNQAIKKAINEDAVLSKLLLAQDGPANTLIITSLVDGAFANDDLSLTVVTPTTLAAGEQAVAEAAMKKFWQDSTLTYAANFATHNGDDFANTAATLNDLVGFTAAGNGATSVLGTTGGSSVTVTVSAALVAGETLVVNGLTIDTAGGLTLAQVESILETGVAAGDAVLTGAYDVAWTMSTGAAGTVVYTHAGVAAFGLADSLTGTAAAAAPAVVTLTGAQSTADTDNIIDMGTGTDVLVLSTSNTANETLKVAGYDLGKTTIVNFSDTGASQDNIDFTAYLVDKASASGSVDSQQTIATSVATAAVAATTVVTANEVVVLNTAAFSDIVATSTFAGLTADKLLAAINSTNAGAANYAGITAATLDATNALAAATTLIGGVGHAVVLIENNQNEGEYKAFELTFNGTATNLTQDFTAAKLIGTFDFGDTVTLTAIGNLVG